MPLTYEQAIEIGADDLLARLVSGYNPDGTDFTLPVNQGQGTEEDVVTALQGAVSATAPARVNFSTTNVTIVAANAARKGLVIHNESSQVLTIKYGETASSTSYTRKIAANSTWEMDKLYKGRIDGLWDAAGSGAAVVTELT